MARWGRAVHCFRVKPTKLDGCPEMRVISSTLHLAVGGILRYALL